MGDGPGLDEARQRLASGALGEVCPITDVGEIEGLLVGVPGDEIDELGAGGTVGHPVAVEGSDCDRVVVTEPEGSAIETGVDVGRICIHCHMADEDAAEIWHAEDCPLAGEGGRRLFDQLDTTGSTPELRPEHQIDILRSSTTTMRHGLRRGEPFAFRCATCGAGDETLAECYHDEFCRLAGLHGPRSIEAARRRAATDGGRE